MTEKIDEIRSRIAEIKQEMLELGDLCPGSISQQVRSWGGKYWQISYTHRGRGHTEYVADEQLDEMKSRNDNYRKFRELSFELVDRYLELSKAEKEERKPAGLEKISNSGARKNPKTKTQAKKKRI